MREMRLKTPDTRGETPSLSGMTIAPVAFSQNGSGAVCLPLVSNSKRLIWVDSNQINLQMDGAAELEKAFDRFPYLTQKQTATLAQLCSLHPDQVKVWFMVQRLRYGISWDDTDIHKVRKKFEWRQEKGELQNRMGDEVKEDTGENKKWNREAKESGGVKAGEVREEQGANEGRMIRENVRADERLGGGVKQEQPVPSQKKRKRATVTNKMGKKRMKQGGEGVLSQLESTLFTRKEVKTRENRRSVNSNPVGAGGCSPTHCNAKTQAQLAMLKMAFSHCQYPDREEYNRLGTVIGVHRSVLVQWFGDMRYYIKKVWPSWMNKEQHCRALANVRYRQSLRALAEVQPREGSRRAAWKMKLDRSESCGGEESPLVPPEQK